MRSSAAQWRALVPCSPFAPYMGSIMHIDDMLFAHLTHAIRYDPIRSNPIPPGWFITIDASWVFLSLFLTQPKSSITEFCIGEKSGILHSSRAAADCPIHHRVDKAVRPSGHKQSSPRSASQPGRLIKWLKFWPSTGRMTLVCVNIKFIIWSSTWSHCQPESAGDIGSGHIGEIGMVIRIGIGLCLMLMTAAYKTGSSGGQTSNICA